METTTATATVTCAYCSGGSVWAGAWKPAVRCIPCNGTGLRPALPCSGCHAPLLDGQDKRWWGADTFHKGC